MVFGDARLLETPVSIFFGLKRGMFLACLEGGIGGRFLDASWERFLAGHSFGWKEEGPGHLGEMCSGMVQNETLMHFP